MKSIYPSSTTSDYSFRHRWPARPWSPANLLRPPKRSIPRTRAIPPLTPAVTVADLTFDTFLPALGVRPDTAVFASALLATSSVVVNFFSGVQLEQKRAELALELERDKVKQQQIRELQGLIARYRGPLLESAIDLEQRVWHLVTDLCFDEGTADQIHEKARYMLFCLSQFLGFVEVVRREGPRERPFLQAGNPQGSDTLSTLLEGVRFVLCASPSYLEDWYLEGANRTHPGARRRRSREEVVQMHIRAEADGSQCPINFDADMPLLRIPRGHQRAIGTMMITTPMGAERHYTMSYGQFHERLESDEQFRWWFKEMEADVIDLATGSPWRGEGPFPVGRWTRAFLLQQLLVELMDLLDPDCVRLPLDRRERLMPVKWGRLPSLESYQRRLKELSASADFGANKAALDGLKDLTKAQTTNSSSDEESNWMAGTAAIRANRVPSLSYDSDDEGDHHMHERLGLQKNSRFSYSSGLRRLRNNSGMTMEELRAEEEVAEQMAQQRATDLEARISLGGKGKE